MPDDAPGRDERSESSGEGFIVREATSFVGSGGISGFGFGGPPPPEGMDPLPSGGRSRDLVCDRCGVVARGVPIPRIMTYRLLHEQKAHPDIFQKRQELQRALADLSAQLWSGDRPGRRNRDEPAGSKPVRLPRGHRRCRALH